METTDTTDNNLVSSNSEEENGIRKDFIERFMSFKKGVHHFLALKDEEMFDILEYILEHKEIKAKEYMPFLVPEKMSERFLDVIVKHPFLCARMVKDNEKLVIQIGERFLQEQDPQKASEILRVIRKCFRYMLREFLFSPADEEETEETLLDATTWYHGDGMVSLYPSVIEDKVEKAFEMSNEDMRNLFTAKEIELMEAVNKEFRAAQMGYYTRFDDEEEDKERLDEDIWDVTMEEDDDEDKDEEELEDIGRAEDENKDGSIIDEEYEMTSLSSALKDIELDEKQGDPWTLTRVVQESKRKEENYQGSCLLGEQSKPLLMVFDNGIVIPKY
jgi:hypothetical protein